MTGANGDTGPGMGAIGRLQVVVRCEHVVHFSLCTLERQSRQRRWLTCWSYGKKLYACAVIKKLPVIFYLHVPLYFRPL